MFASAKEEDGSVYSSDVRVEDKYVDWHRKKKPSAMNIVSPEKKERQRPPVTRDTHARNRPATTYISSYTDTLPEIGKCCAEYFFRLLISQKNNNTWRRIRLRRRKKKTFNRAHFATCSLFKILLINHSLL